MRESPRETALNFLVGEHQLPRDMAEQTLALADTVLRDGLSRLKAAAEAGDLATCLETAHGLKGNLLNLGLPELAQVAHAVVAAARSGEAAASRRLAAELVRSVVPFFAATGEESPVVG